MRDPVSFINNIQYDLPSQQPGVMGLPAGSGVKISSIKIDPFAVGTPIDDLSIEAGGIRILVIKS